jgi:hypothetical protein
MQFVILNSVEKFHFAIYFEFLIVTLLKTHFDYLTVRVMVTKHGVVLLI